MIFYEQIHLDLELSRHVQPQHFQKQLQPLQALKSLYGKFIRIAIQFSLVTLNTFRIYRGMFR